MEAARGGGEQGNEAWALRLLGDAAATRRDRPAAAERYREALALARRLGMVPVIALCAAASERHQCADIPVLR